MQLGFVIDHSRCIGCHACTVACKAENDVPVGSFRTWVKYVEQGEFPTVKRSFSVLRCNQCTHAPCVAICPVNALHKRDDGIVDIDPKACIGCKACMQGCPYDALYINEGTGIAEKCHFCAHRTEVGLTPACAAVCPTEAIIPGDFDDPESRVSQMRSELDLSGRKTEAGTRPNVLYRDVEDVGIDPGLTSLAHGFLWAESPTGARVEADRLEDVYRPESARTSYDAPKPKLWGRWITGYLFAKSIAAGVALVSVVAALSGQGPAQLGRGPLALALAALTVTCICLIADLKRPERFYLLFLRPNWNSWLARGTFVLALFGGLLAAALVVPTLTGPPAVAVVIAVLALFAACYTGWLFGQARGRVLWMMRGYPLQLAVQALLAGSACLLVLQTVLPTDSAIEGQLLRWVLGSALLGQLAFDLVRGQLSPRDRNVEYARAVRLLHGGRHGTLRVLVLGFGIVGPLVLVGLGALLPVAGLLALVGLWLEEDAFVLSGQALPIS